MLLEHPLLSPKNLGVEVLPELNEGVLVERKEGVLQRRVELSTIVAELPRRNMGLADEPDFASACPTRTPPLCNKPFSPSSVGGDGTVAGSLCRFGCKKFIAFSTAIYADLISSLNESTDDVNFLKFWRVLM